MNYLIKTTSRARFSTWAAVKSWFFAAERCTLWQQSIFVHQLFLGQNRQNVIFLAIFLQDWILNFMRENSNFASVWFFAAAESSLVLSWHFSIAYKGIKRKKEKNLHEVEQRLGKLLPLHANFENHAQSSGEALTSLLYETYLASRLTYFSNLPAPKLLWV